MIKKIKIISSILFFVGVFFIAHPTATHAAVEFVTTNAQCDASCRGDGSNDYLCGGTGTWSCSGSVSYTTTNLGNGYCYDSGTCSSWTRSGKTYSNGYAVAVGVGAACACEYNGPVCQNTINSPGTIRTAQYPCASNGLGSGTFIPGTPTPTITPVVTYFTVSVSPVTATVYNGDTTTYKITITPTTDPATGLGDGRAVGRYTLPTPIPGCPTGATCTYYGPNTLEIKQDTTSYGVDFAVPDNTTVLVTPTTVTPGTYILDFSATNQFGQALHTPANLIVSAPSGPPPVSSNLVLTCPSPGTTVNASWSYPVGWNTAYVRANVGANNFTWPSSVIQDTVVGNTASFASTNGQTYTVWVHTRNPYDGTYSSYISANVTCPTGAVPNLTASPVTPTTANTGIPATFSSTISNTGTGSTNAAFSAFFQVATGANGGGTVTDLTSSMMNTLAAGSVSTATSPAYTFATAGTYSIRACADKTNSGNAGVIAESNESDNCGAWTTVTVTTSVPTATITPSVTTIAVGQTVNFTITGTSNTGLDSIGLESTNSAGTPISNLGIFYSSANSATHVFPWTPSSAGTYYFDGYAWSTGLGALTRTTPPVVITVSNSCDPTAVGTNQMLGCVYSGTTFNTLTTTPTLTGSTLSSPTPASASPLPDFNWGTGGPGSLTDNFSVRWKGRFTLPAGTYTFSTASDDGSRAYFDNNNDGVPDSGYLVNDWTDHSTRTTAGSPVTVAAGTYTIVYEMYEASGGASYGLSWTSTPLAGTSAVIGKVCKDDNGNGTCDTGESYIRDTSLSACTQSSVTQSGITINYSGAQNGSALINECSPTSGYPRYSATSLPAGTYTVTPSLPSGWVATGCIQSAGGAFTNCSVPTSGSVTIANGGVENVTFTIKPSTGASFTIGPSSMSFSGTTGGSAPASQVMQTISSGTSDVWYTASSDKGWCKINGSTSITGAVGATPPGQSSPVLISVDAPGVVGAGTFTCTITITDPNASPTTRTIPITYTVGAGTTYTVTIDPVVGGTTSSGDGGISCGTTCSHSYSSGTPVTLTATPASSQWKFVGWGGDCSGINPSISVSVTSNKHCIANYRPQPFQYKEF